MSRAGYYREQAQVLASLALATDDPKKADSYKLAALEHLKRAEDTEQSMAAPPGQETA
jgi:hypothetical protein